MDEAIKRLSVLPEEKRQALEKSDQVQLGEILLNPHSERATVSWDQLSGRRLLTTFAPEHGGMPLGKIFPEAGAPRARVTHPLLLPLSALFVAAELLTARPARHPVRSTRRAHGTGATPPLARPPGE